jgi:hypothetical protein
MITHNLPSHGANKGFQVLAFLTGGAGVGNGDGTFGVREIAGCE